LIAKNIKAALNNSDNNSMVIKYADKALSKFFMADFMKTVVSTWCIVCLVLSTFIFPFSTAYAVTTIYVNYSTGNDTTGDGSSGNPYKTFYKAYTVAVSGDTINLTGTFDWTNADETGDAAGSGYSISKNLTIQGQGVDSTIIQANPTENTADRAVFYISATVTIKDLTIRNGVTTSAYRGGGITNYGTLTIQSARVTQNHANVAGTNYWGAGGIYTEQNTTLNITNSTFDSNIYNGKAYGSGGVYSTQSATINVTGSTFNNNQGICSEPTTYPYSYSKPSGAMGTFRFCTVRVTNSTFYANSSNSYGGAIQIYYDNSYNITNCTIVNNSATLGAGGVSYRSEWDGYNLYLKNSILADNTSAGSGDDFYAYDSASGNRITDNGYNIVEYSTNKTWSGTGDITGNQANLNVDSQLQDNYSLNGPDTLALLSGSIAINAGDPANTANNGTAIPTTDERGGTRNGTTDIGAYEYNAGGIITQYTLTYSAGANGSISGTSPQTVNSGSDGTAVTAVPDTGYHFVNWSDDSTANPRTDTSVVGNVSVTANFAIDTHSLNYSAGSNGTLTGTTAQTINYGSDGSAVTAVPATGYSFIDWSDSSTDNPRTDTNITSDVSVTANFADITAPSVPGAPSTTTPTTDTTPTWTWTASTDNGSGLHATPYTVEWSMDSLFISGVISTTSTSNTFSQPSALSEGTWYFKVKAKDADNNISAYSSSGSVVIYSNPAPTPTTPPETTIKPDPDAPKQDNGWYKKVPDVDLENDQEATIYYRWDNDPTWHLYTGPMKAKRGQHTLYYYSSGGVDETVKNKVFYVDDTKPKITAKSFTALAKNTTNKIKYRISDKYSSKARVIVKVLKRTKVKIKNKWRVNQIGFMASKVCYRRDLGWVKTNKLISFKYKPRLKSGLYVLSIYARDKANNKQLKAFSKRFRIIANTKNYPILRFKDANNYVKILQQRLNMHRVTVKIDGVFEEETLWGVREFKSRRKLSNPDVVDANTWYLLMSAVGK